MIKLSTATDYSNDRKKLNEVELETYISTDNLLSGKEGISLALNLPPTGNTTPAYKPKNILVANIRPYLKKIWFSDREGGCSADVLVFKVKHGFDPKFVYYSLFRDDFFDHMIKGAKGTRMPRGNKDQIMDYVIPDFDYSSQVNISNVLSALDNKIEINRRIAIKLKSLLKLIYDYWFVQFNFPDENGKPYKSSGGKMVWSDMLNRDIPHGWDINKLSDLTSLIIDHRGKTPKKLQGNWLTDKKGGIIALSAKHIKDGKLIGVEDANRVDRDLYNRWMPEKLKRGDIIMTSEAPLGEFYFLAKKTEYCLSQRVFAIRANKEKIVPSYLYYELSRGYGFPQITGRQSGSTVFGIRQDELRLVNILVPSKNVREKFEEIAKPMLELVDASYCENNRLKEVRDWLLPMLMNGQVTVKN